MDIICAYEFQGTKKETLPCEMIQAEYVYARTYVRTSLHDVDGFDARDRLSLAKAAKKGHNGVNAVVLF